MPVGHPEPENHKRLQFLGVRAPTETVQCIRDKAEATGRPVSHVTADVLKTGLNVLGWLDKKPTDDVTGS